MAKKVIGEIKLQLPGGQATPAPPVGPALGQHGLNIMDFCKAFNARTQKEQGIIIPVVITVYALWRFFADTGDPLEIFLVLGLPGGFVLLFLSVLIDRLRELKTDRYRGVQR